MQACSRLINSAIIVEETMIASYAVSRMIKCGKIGHVVSICRTGKKFHKHLLHKERTTVGNLILVVPQNFPRIDHQGNLKVVTIWGEGWNLR